MWGALDRVRWQCHLEGIMFGCQPLYGGTRKCDSFFDGPNLTSYASWGLDHSEIREPRIETRLALVPFEEATIQNETKLTTSYLESCVQAIDYNTCQLHAPLRQLQARQVGSWTRDDPQFVWTRYDPPIEGFQWQAFRLMLDTADSGSERQARPFLQHLMINTDPNDTGLTPDDHDDPVFLPLQQRPRLIELAKDLLSEKRSQFLMDHPSFRYPTTRLPAGIHHHVDKYRASEDECLVRVIEGGYNFTEQCSEGYKTLVDAREGTKLYLYFVEAVASVQTALSCVLAFLTIVAVCHHPRRTETKAERAQRKLRMALEDPLLHNYLKKKLEKKFSPEATGDIMAKLHVCAEKRSENYESDQTADPVWSLQERRRIAYKQKIQTVWGIRVFLVAWIVLDTVLLVLMLIDSFSLMAWSLESLLNGMMVLSATVVASYLCMPTPRLGNEEEIELVTVDNEVV